LPLHILTQHIVPTPNQYNYLDTLSSPIYWCEFIELSKPSSTQVHLYIHCRCEIISAVGNLIPAGPGHVLTRLNSVDKIVVSVDWRFKGGVTDK